MAFGLPICILDGCTCVDYCKAKYGYSTELEKEWNSMTPKEWCQFDWARLPLGRVNIKHD